MSTWSAIAIKLEGLYQIYRARGGRLQRWSWLIIMEAIASPWVQVRESEQT